MRPIPRAIVSPRRALIPAVAALLALWAAAPAAAALPDSMITGAVGIQRLSAMSTGLTSESGRTGGLPEDWCSTGTETATDDTANAVNPPSTPQLKVVYAYAADQPDRFAALQDPLQADVSLLSRYMAAQSGGAKTLRFDLGTDCGAGYADIASVQLPQPLSAYLVGGDPQLDLIAADVRAVLAPGVMDLVVYADGVRAGSSHLGEGEVVDDDQAGAGNLHNAGGLVSVVYGASTAPTGYAAPAAMMHGIGHLLGAVQPSAPHYAAGGHCGDEWDVMCDPDDPGATAGDACAPTALSTVDKTFDCAGDDYFDPAPASGDYLADHWNTFDAAQLATCSDPTLSGACGVADTAPPVDTTAAVPAAGGSGWHTVPVDVQLTGTDAGSGVRFMEYELDGVATQVLPDATVTIGEGTHTLRHRALDAAGNASAWTAPETVKVDSVAPANTTTSLAGSWTASDPTVTLSGTDATSGVDHVEWQLDGGPVTQSPAGTTVTVSGDAVHTLRTRVLDVAGHATGWRTDTIRVDTTLPQDDTAVSAGWRNAAAAIVVSGSDAVSGVARVEWTIDDDPTIGSGPSGTSVPVTGEGDHTLRTRVVDNAGNTTGWAAHTVRIDTTAPANDTPAAPAGWRSASYSVALEGSDPGGSGLRHLQWSVDGGPAAGAAAGTTVTVSGDGAHTLRTRAVDLAGNSSAWRSESVSIDTVTPTDDTVGPTGAVANPYVLTITGSDLGSGIGHVEWRLEGGAITTGPDGSQVTLSGAGAHHVSERVYDAAGNATPWRDLTITIDTSLNNDTTPPVDTTTAAPVGWQTHAVTLTAWGTDTGGSDMARVEWRVDGRPIASAAAATTLTFDTSGVHHVETRVTDGAGNATAWRAQVVKLDLDVPTDATAIPGGWVNTPAFTVDGSDATSGIDRIEWSIAGGASGDDPATTAVPVPGDGTYTISHRAVDVAGQASAWATGTLRVDTVAPSDTTATTPAGWQTSPWTVTPAGTDALSGLDHADVRIDGGDVLTGAQTIDTDGTHSVETRAVDKAGNTSGWRTQSVQVDVDPPTDTTPSAPAGWRRVAWHVTPSADDGDGSGVATLQWRLGSGGTISGDPDAVVDAEGVSTLQTRAIDAVGHASAWRSQTVRIDRTVPSLGLDCGSGAWSAAPVTCTVHGDGGPSGLSALTLTRSGSAASAVGDGSRVAVGANGAWTMTLAATDGAGNHAAVIRTVRVDRTPPVAGLSCAPAAAPTGWSCRAAGSDTLSGLSALRWRVDGGAWRAPGSGGTFAVASGRVEVLAIDRAGLRTVSAAATLPAPAPAGRLHVRSVPVSKRHSHGRHGLLGAFELRSQQMPGAGADVAADVRPLVLRRGRYRVSIRLWSGELSAKRTRHVHFRHVGNTPRIGVALSGVEHKVHARLVLDRRRRHARRHGHHRRWKRVAVTTAKLRP